MLWQLATIRTMFKKRNKLIEEYCNVDVDKEVLKTKKRPSRNSP